MTVEPFLPFSRVDGISPIILYHLAGRFLCMFTNTGLVATSFFRSLKVPCLFYIDDRHNGQLQISLDRVVYADIQVLMSVDLQLQNQPFFLWPICLINLGIF